MLTVHTASFFEPQNHTGDIRSISLKNPIGVEFDQEIIFAPTWEIVLYWKGKVSAFKAGKIQRLDLDIAWNIYTKKYTQMLDSRYGAIALWVNYLKDDVTLCCYEKPSDPVPNCHRNILGEWLNTKFGLEHIADMPNRRPLVAPTIDRTLTKEPYPCKTTADEALEIKLKQLSEMGIKAEIFVIESDFYSLAINGEHLGVWGGCAIVCVLSQIISPTYPASWFISQGIAPYKRSIEYKSGDRFQLAA